MEYTVRVVHASRSVEPKVDTFGQDTRDADELNDLHTEAVDAYTSAVQTYDHGHTVSLFRDGVTLHEALGTGTGRLADETDDVDENADNPTTHDEAVRADVADDRHDEAVRDDVADEGRHAEK